ncbi:MAG: electron transfer flavoprotein subunit alpha/FixB family protein [Dehalococcoidia bacterium]|jgi:electron transfer flavoprotein alpha subunit|nr:electron transfer flavoprotein subunit alpha/FixB family protein [Dehalococcoidia bacterium]
MIVPAYPPHEARGIWVFLEQDDGILAPVSLELLARARELASESGAELTGLLAGGDIPATETEAAGLDLDRVVSVSHPLLAQFTAEAYAYAVAQVILEQKPDMFLLGATAYGRDLAGRLAVILRTGLTADCTGLALESGTGLLLGEVSGFGGGVVATIRCENHRPQMATVRPGVFPEPVLTPRPKASVVRMVVDIPAHRRPVHVVDRRHRAGVDISRAERLVVAGAGARGHMDGIEALAVALGAEIGATRVAVDEGWATRERQIGQTGVIARPKVAVVCGASGASQFTVGIEQAGLVVAVNQDAEAPIFEQADLCVVDDVSPVIHALVAELQSHAGGAS